MTKSKKAKARRKSRLPSEADIIEFVRDQDGRVGKREIARAFSIKGAARIDLKKMLRKMKEDGLLASDKRRLRDAGDLPNVTVLKVVGPDDDGDLIAVPNEWDGENGESAPRVLVLPPGKTDGITKPPGQGDRILARLTRLSDTDEGSPHYQGRIIRVLARQTDHILGVVRITPGTGMRIVPVDKRNRMEFTVDRADAGDARSGDLVSVEPIRSRAQGLPRARVVDVLGPVGDQRSISMIAIHQHGLPHRFPERVIAEAEGIGEPDLAPLTDLRHVPLITIDPADARDHDDAVWAAPDDDPRNPDGFKVIVAIADVARYVKPGSAIDREARERGNSVYFPDRVVPMLPERLSTDLCSLRAEEDRPALAVTMVFDAEGRKRHHAFDRIAMRSAAKLSYVLAQRAVDGDPDAETKPLLEPILRPLWQAYGAVAQARDKRNPLALDIPERKIVFDDKGEIERIVTPERLDAHRLIEEFMILANVCAAETLEAKRTALLYRVHDAPSADKLTAFAEFLATLGLTPPKGQVMKPQHFNRILDKVEGHENERLVHDMVLRTQSQAVYAADNLGHFGLNLRRYAHFTSPIRRYADLIVHRALITALKLGKDGLSDWDIAHLSETAEQISATERRAMAAERDTVDRLIAAHLAQRVGAEFSGRIAGVTSAGLFVELDETGANGFVPISTLGREYYDHDQAAQALIGSTSGETYRMGDRVEVRLEEVTPIAGGLRFELLSQGRAGKPLRGRHRTGATRKPRRPHRGRKRRD